MLTNTNARFNGFQSLPLFFWAEMQQTRLGLLTLAERHLVRHFSLKPHTARTLSIPHSAYQKMHWLDGRYNPRLDLEATGGFCTIAY